MPIDPLTLMPLEPMTISRRMEVLRSEHDAYSARPGTRPFLDERACVTTVMEATHQLIKDYRAAGRGYHHLLILALKIEKALPVFGRPMESSDWADLRNAFTYFALEITGADLAALQIKCDKEQRKDGKTLRMRHYERWAEVIVTAAKDGWEKYPDWNIGKMCDEIFKRTEATKKIAGRRNPSKQSIRKYIVDAGKAGKLSIQDAARRPGRPRRKLKINMGLSR
jgi:hypothetical protein